MKHIKEVIEDPMKSKIMSFSCYRTKFSINELGEEVGIQGVELQKALNSLVLSNFLIRDGNYYKKTAKGGIVAYALKEYEETSESLAEINITKISSSNVILDIGCGGGAHLSGLGRCCANTIGIDVDPEFLYIAKLKSGAKLIRADAHFLPFKSNISDLVLCYLVIPLVSDEERVLAEASRVLKTNGSISLTLHGLGFYLRLIFGKRRRGLKEKLVAGLAILSTICNRLVGKKLGFKGRSIATFQTEKGISKILKRHQIEVIKSEKPQGNFMGVPVFIRMEGRKK